MTKPKYEELVDIHIPNFRRIQEILDTENDILVDLALMIKKVYDIWLLETLWKYINLELGICILKDKEIDREKMQELVKSFKK